MTAFSDINLLPDTPHEDEEGHVEDHGILHRGLKAVANDTRVPLSTYISLEEPQIYPGVNFTVNNAPPSWSIESYWDYLTKGNRIEIPGPPMVNDGSGVFYAAWNGSNAGANSVSHEEAFFLQGPKLSGMFYSYGDFDVQIMVDGKLVKPSWTVLPNTADFVFLHLDFTDDTSLNKIRNIRVFIGQVGLYQWLTPAGGDLWPDKTRRYTFGVAAADSYYHGAHGTTEGSISGGTLAHQMTIFTGGKTRTINAGAQGGTGYKNPATGTAASIGPNGQTPFGSAARRNAYSAWASQVDCLLIAGGANDTNDSIYPVNSTVEAANQCWNDYAAIAPDKPLIVIGIQSGVYVGDFAKLETLNNALREKALANPNVTAYIDDRNPAMISGTGKINAKTGDGNADIMICSDGVHQTRFANEYITRQRIARMGKVLVPVIGG